MQIPKAIYDQMLEQAREEAPNECCGILGGKDGAASTMYPATNAEQSPLRYTLDPKDLYRITFQEIPEKDEEMLAIYHSHTKSAAYPSQTDVNQAVNWPDAIYLIVSLQDEEAPEVKGYWLKDLRIADAELIVE